MENYSNTIPSKTEKGRSSVIATTSEGGREDAHKNVAQIIVDKIKLENEEWEALQLEKRKIDAELSKYNKAAFMQQQARVRRKYRGFSPDKSIEAWASKRTELESERQELIKQKFGIEERLSFLKRKRQDRSRSEDVMSEGYKITMIEEIRITNTLLRKILGILSQK